MSHRARQSSGRAHRKTIHKTTRDLVSGLGGAWPGSARLQSAVYRHMRSRRLHDGLIRPEPGTLMGCSPAPAPSPAVQAPSLAGHGQTALGPRPIPRRSHLELNPRSRLISPGWRGKTLMSSSADSPAFPPVRADAAGAAGARYIRPARVRSYPLPHPPCSVSRGPEHMA